MRAADAVLLPPLRRSGKILFEFTENVGDRRRWTLLDAGRPFLASRILILFGRPFRIDPPEEPPTLEASLDGVLFFPLPLRPVEEGAVADTEGKAIRFLRVGGPDGHHAYILLHNTRHMQRKDREEPPDR